MPNTDSSPIGRGDGNNGKREGELRESQNASCEGFKKKLHSSTCMEDREWLSINKCNYLWMQLQCNYLWKVLKWLVTMVAVPHYIGSPIYHRNTFYFPSLV